MNSISFITDETHHKRYAQIDLEDIAKLDGQAIEDLVDILIAESRKGEESSPWESFKEELIKEGKIDVSNNYKVIS